MAHFVAGNDAWRVLLQPLGFGRYAALITQFMVATAVVCLIIGRFFLAKTVCKCLTTQGLGQFRSAF
jgi:uncharacterized membrane protein HdeD (DUF308 family)